MGSGGAIRHDKKGQNHRFRGKADLNFVPNDFEVPIGNWIFACKGQKQVWAGDLGIVSL